MAGNYPDAPGHRINYDLDGTQGYILQNDLGSVVSTLSQDQITRLNDEDPGSTPKVSLSVGQYCMLYLSRPIQLRGLMLQSQADRAGVSNVEISEDTTTGLDGVWSAIPWTEDAGTSVTAYRTAIEAMDIGPVRAIRVRAPASGFYGLILQAIHLYGDILESDLRLAVWDPVADEQLAPAALDWGDDPRNSQETATFRIKNLDTASTAQTVGVSITALTDTGYAAAHQLSLDDVTYASTVDVGDLAPEAISAEIYVRRDYGAAQELGTKTARIVTTPTGWL